MSCAGDWDNMSEIFPFQKKNIFTLSFRIFDLPVFLSFNVTSERKMNWTTQSSFVFQEDYVHNKQSLKPTMVCHYTELVRSHRH
jgi:hypothetical protein